MTTKKIEFKGQTYDVPSDSITVPTGFDLQVHLRFPGQPEKETLLGGLEAAYAGGYDSLLTMPNTRPFLDTPERLREAIQELQRESTKLPPVQVYWTGAATLGMRGKDVSDIAGLVAAGASAITDDGWGVPSDDAMKKIFQRCADCDVPFLQHAEMPGHGGVATKSVFQQTQGLAEYPRTAESAMVERDLHLLSEVPSARYHVLHVSTKETLQLIRNAKEKGMNVTCEVTPHHLLFDSAMIPPASELRNTFFKMNPPLFTAEDRLALIDALEEGLTDCVSTDHAPHELVAKQKPWAEAPFGTRGLQTALLALLELHDRGQLSMSRLFEVYATAGRKILGISTQSEGVVIVERGRNYPFTEGELKGVSVNSIFLETVFNNRLYGRIDSEHGLVLL